MFQAVSQTVSLSIYQSTWINPKICAHGGWATSTTAWFPWFPKLLFNKEGITDSAGWDTDFSLQMMFHMFYRQYAWIQTKSQACVFMCIHTYIYIIYVCTYLSPALVYMSTFAWSPSSPKHTSVKVTDVAMKFMSPWHTFRYLKENHWLLRSTSRITPKEAKVLMHSQHLQVCKPPPISTFGMGFFLLLLSHAKTWKLRNSPKKWA